MAYIILDTFFNVLVHLWPDQNLMAQRYMQNNTSPLRVYDT